MFISSLRTLLEGNLRGEPEASDEMMTGTFRDPEGKYYLARQLAYLSDSAARPAC